jgi:hypothetical protein
VPLFCAALAFSFAYNVDKEVYVLIPIFSSFLVIWGIDWFYWKKSPLSSTDLFLDPAMVDEKMKKIMLIFSFFIIGMGFLDLYHHGLVFLTPYTYATFTPFQSWIRNFSSLCWVLIPIAMLCRFNVFYRVLLIVWPLLFPVLVYDRNRLLMAFFSLMITLLFNRKVRSSKKVGLGIVVTTFIGLLSFIVLGNGRVGSEGIMAHYKATTNNVELARACNLPKLLPVKEEIKNLPTAFQWLFLYGTASVYNLGVQFKCKVEDASLLKAQLIPLWRRYNQAGQPLLVSSGLNVATEILPFYLAFGVSGIFFVLILEFLILRYFMIKSVREKSLISFFIFLRLAYCAFFVGFAPQFFIWTTLGFLIVMKSIEVFYRSSFSNFIIKKIG